MMIFNCMSAGDDFSSFVSFEIAPVRDQSEPDQDGTDLAISSPEAAEVWTIYGRLKTGEAMALHDAVDEVALAAQLITLHARAPRPLGYVDEDRRIENMPTIAALGDALTMAILDDIEGGQSEPGAMRDDAFDCHPLAPIREALLMRI